MVAVGPRSTAAAPERITRRADLCAWVAADLRSYDLGGASPTAVGRRLMVEPQLRWQLRLRVVELLTNRAGSRTAQAVAALARWRVQQSGVRLGFTIPPNVFGPGLKLPHWGTIVISPEVMAGRRCTVHPGVTIGLNHGRAPRIGDDVYLGPGAKVFGGVTIGDRVAVGANSVVTRDIPPDTRVVGVPARPIRTTEEAAADHAGR